MLYLCNRCGETVGKPADAQATDNDHEIGMLLVECPNLEKCEPKSQQPKKRIKGVRLTLEQIDHILEIGE